MSLTKCVLLPACPSRNRAFLDPYAKYSLFSDGSGGLNMDEFIDAREVVASLSAEYEACERPDYVSAAPPPPPFPDGWSWVAKQPWQHYTNSPRVHHSTAHDTVGYGLCATHLTALLADSQGAPACCSCIPADPSRQGPLSHLLHASASGAWPLHRAGRTSPLVLYLPACRLCTPCYFLLLKTACCLAHPTGRFFVPML